jgi:diaminopimelate decarboxylase
MIKLSPRISAEARVYVDRQNVLKQLLNIYGSPLNVVLPDVAFQNYSTFKDLFTSLNLKNRVYFASKANKSKSILKRMAFSDAQVDVASVHELIDALASGFSGDRIEATGPKNKEFLKLCVLHGVTINVDDCNELIQIESICNSMPNILPSRKVPIYIRISIPTALANKPDRFGIPIPSLDTALSLVKEARHLLLKGFSFHFSTDKIDERVQMLKCALDILIQQKMSTHPNFSITDLDIGGGYLINQLESKVEWDTYLTALKTSVLNGDSENMSWNKAGLGFSVEGGKLKGSKSFSDFYQGTTQFDALKQILSARHERMESTYADILRDLDLTICIEPGQSFFDQAGFTLARVMNIKKTENNLSLIVLDMNRSNINANDTEYMPDPIHIKGDRQESGETSAGFLVGNLCLPSDFISRRKFNFEQPVCIGDILLFSNTAPYLMDFSESRTLKQNVARKIAMVHRNTELQYFEDENYTHI